MSDERTLDLLEAKIEELRQLNAVEGIDLTREIARLEEFPWATTERPRRPSR